MRWPSTETSTASSSRASSAYGISAAQKVNSPFVERSITWNGSSPSCIRSSAAARQRMSNSSWIAGVMTFPRGTKVGIYRAVRLGKGRMTQEIQLNTGVSHPMQEGYLAFTCGLSSLIGVLLVRGSALIQTLLIFAENSGSRSPRKRHPAARYDMRSWRDLAIGAGILARKPASKRSGGAPAAHECRR